MPPDPQTQNPAGGRGSAVKHATGQAQGNVNAPPRRCPWFDDVTRLAADPAPAYIASRDRAMIFAGTGAWDRATDTHQAGRRACTVLPPGTDPRNVRWPSVRFWIGDTGDLPTTEAIELARALIDAGAELVQLVGQYLRPSLTMRRASRGN